MAIEKALLLKGLGVCAICAGGATVALKWGDISNALFSPAESKRKEIAWGGLECEEPTEQEGGECKLKTGEKIFIKKKGGSSHFQLTSLEGGGKIKVYKVQKTEGEDGYSEGFKFLVEEGDIGTGENNKLEEFETYEIKKGTDSNEADLKDQYFLSQKTDSKTEIKKALGLHWDLTDASQEQANITNENVGAIKFKGGTASLAGDNVTLKISKETDKTQYPLGYKFTFKNTVDTAATLTIGNEVIKIKKDSPIDYDFKIKRNGSSLSLEKAWSIEDLAKKVGLVKESEGDYWDVGQEGLNVKVGTTKKDKKTKKDGSQGKIKVYEGQSEYNGGFKFTIENGDLNLNDDGSTTIILEEFQSYEIVKEGEKWYLSKKDDGQERIKELLGIKCEVPEGQTDCSLTAQNVKTIKFKGGKATLSGNNVTLTISKDSSKEEYPLGFKFSFKNTNDSDATLTYGGETITLKKESPVEFKIKKEESSLTLEKAWTLETLAAKVGLVKEGDLWNVGTEGLNVNLEGTKKVNKVKYSNPTGRIKVYSDQKGYNEGLKFTIEKGDIDLKEEKDKSNTFNLGQFQSFEIVKDSDGTWYLSRKVGDQSGIKELLGIKCELPSGSNSSAECALTSENIGSAKFEGAGQGSVTVTGSPKLTIHKESGRLDYPLGYRFVFSSDADATITIPTSPETKITLKKNLSVDYKIKVSGDNKDVLTLEKAWTADALIKEASFISEGSDKWTLGGGGIKIKQDKNKSDNATGTGTQKAKIRVNEGTPGYNQGYKFVVEEGDTQLDSSGNGISKLFRYETYEVVKDATDGEWYFTRKQKSGESIKERLGLPDGCSIPTTKDQEVDCSLDSEDKLKAIKFEGKGEGEKVTVDGNTLTLKIRNTGNSDDEYGGYKFTLKTTKDVTIPQPSSSSLTVKANVDMEFKIKESSGNLTLERMWTPERLGKKLGLTCTGNKCTFGSTINVWDEENNYVDGASITGANGKSLIYEENADNHNQRIKFTVDGESDIEISGSTGGTNKPNKICKNNGGNQVTYEIAQKTPTGGSAKWYLVKKN